MLSRFLPFLLSHTYAKKIKGNNRSTSFKVISISCFLLQVEGEISYNGHQLGEFVPQNTSAYISQYDLHIPEISVRETIDFSARCQGIGSRAGKQALSIQVHRC